VVRSPNAKWVGSLSFLGRKSNVFLSVRTSSYNIASGTTGFWGDHWPITVVKNGYAPAPYPAVVNSNTHRDKNNNYSNNCSFAIDDITDYMILKIVVDASATADNLALYPNYQIGRNETLSSGEFDIAEIIGYNTTLSAEDDAAIGAYLEDKYGLPAPNYADVTPQALFVNFSINGLPTRIDQARREITVTAVSPVNLSVLVPTFTLSAGATCTVDGATVTSGVTAVNHSPAHYIVTSADASKTTDYSVTVNLLGRTGKVNLDIDYSVLTGLYGPGGGSGETWNTTNQTSASSLRDSGSALGSVGFTSTNMGGPDEWGSPSLAMLRQGLRNFDTAATNSQQFVVNGLDSTRTYDLYIASANLSSQRHNGVWATTNTTSTPGDHPCGNTAVANGTTWVEGNNYVVFKEVVPDAGGRITVNGHSISVAGFDCRLPVSGFQLVDLYLAALPAAVISDLTASQTIPLGTPSVTLSGTLGDGGTVYAADGDVAAVTINGRTYYAAVAGGAGGFSIALPTASLPASETPYPITYRYVGNGTTLNAAPNNTDTAVTVTVTAGDPYATWIASKQLSGADAAVTADPERDGVPNSIEFVLGGEPNPASANCNSRSLLPGVTRTSDGALIFTFHRKVISKSSALLTFQWSTNLSFPLSNNVTVGSAGSTTNGVTVDVTENNPDVDTDLIVVSVPASKAVGGKLFGRLGVTIQTTVPNVSAYDAWLASKHLTGADTATTADPDQDAISNLLEFVLDGEPNPSNPGSNSRGLLPTVAPSGGNLVFTYRCRAASLTQPGIAITAEYGSDLRNWTPAQHGVNGVSIVVTPDGFEAGIDKVKVSIPQSLAAGSKFFVHLKVTMP
jgi:hypothetical protein